MNKAWIVLLLISAVIGMTAPVMATAPDTDVSSNVDVNVEGTNWAVNKIIQSQEMEGDQYNGAVVEVLGGDADSSSNADADGDADNSGEAETDDDDSAALAGNLLSGNGVAVSESEANAGYATNYGDVVQINAVVQFADADIDNHQTMKQKVIVPVDLETEIEVDEDTANTTNNTTDNTTIDDSVVDNHLHDSELEIEEE